MRRFDLLVRDARDATGNQLYTSTQGVKQREFVRHGNDAQMRIYNKILQERSTLYVKKAFLSAVAGQAEYTLPTDIFLKHNIVKVDYSFNGSALNYSPLDMRTPRQEVSVQGYPASYFLRDGVLVVSPIPSNSVANAFRLNYQYTLPDIDVRRGTVSNFNVDGSGNFYTNMNITGLTDESVSELTGGYVDFVSIVDVNGTIKSTTSGCGVSGYNSTTTLLTFTGSTVPTTIGITVGDYVVFGKYASSHSQLPDVAERYLTDYMALRIQMRDSNNESIEQSQVLQLLEREILDAIAELEEDLPAVPILDVSFLNYAEDL